MEAIRLLSLQCKAGNTTSSMSARLAKITMPATTAMIPSFKPRARNPIDDSGRRSTRTTYSIIPATHAQTMSSYPSRFTRPASSWIQEPTGRLKNPSASSTPTAEMRQLRELRRTPIAGISTDISATSLRASTTTARSAHHTDEFIQRGGCAFAIAGAHELEEQAVEHCNLQRCHGIGPLRGRQRHMHELDPTPRIAREVAAIGLGVLRRQELQLVEQPQRAEIPPGGRPIPEDPDRRLALFPGRNLGERLPEAAVQCIQHLGEKPLPGAEVVDQKARTGTGGGSQWPQRQIRQAVLHQIRDRRFQNFLLARYHVTNVTCNDRFSQARRAAAPVLLVRRGVDHFPTDDRVEDVGAEYRVGGHRHDVAVEDGDVGPLAGLERSGLTIVELHIRTIRSVGLERLLARELLRGEERRICSDHVARHAAVE